ncbi:MAG: VOC family protein, partial [Tetragenococcus koreensis]|nr:VOC family protein [Tetragenococcus koreensis]
MKLEHIAIWGKDIEKMKAFYQKYFNVGSTELYHNQKTDFRSYFLTFEEGSRIELTTK